MKINKNKVVIDFNKKFYSEKSIEESSLAYTNICNAQIVSIGNYIRISLTDLKENPEMVAREFSNYVLSLQRE
jgi:hypothetical protein